jgi:hypothetical protein
LLPPDLRCTPPCSRSGLGTGNEREANRLAVPHIAHFLGLIEQARQQAKLIDPWDGEV